MEIMVEDEPILYNFENLKDNNKEKKKEIIDYIKILLINLIKPIILMKEIIKLFLECSISIVLKY